MTSQVPPGGLGGPKCAECQSVPCNGRRNACHRLPTEVHLLVTEDQPSVATDNVGSLLSSARYGRRIIKSLLGLPTKTKQTTGKRITNVCTFVCLFREICETALFRLTKWARDANDGHLLPAECAPLNSGRDEENLKQAAR